VAMAYTTKYDFVPGERIIAYEDFSNTEIGDFPTRWNTNASAEVVTLNNKPGKWLKITKEGTFHPEYITT
jgi:OmpA-OmpF porin, OOP family